METKRAYFDWNATAPFAPEALKAFNEAADFFGNPSSVHAEGRAARALLERSRGSVAEFMGCEPDEVVFTSGGFEANNIALNSLAANAAERSFAVAPVEHGSILGILTSLEAEGYVRHTLKVSREGLIEPDTPLPELGFAAFQAMNQETGALQPVARFGERMAEAGVPWHCDAVQLWGRAPFSARGQTFATASLTGHKLGAPKGTGALFARRGVEIRPLFKSGPQEKGRRPGTENVQGAAALAAALDAASKRLSDYRARSATFREHLVTGLKKLRPDAVVHGPGDPALQVPNTLSISFPGLEGALLVPALDLEGVAVSAGSACASGATKPSPVLLAMGLPEDLARGTIRISSGWATTEEDVETLLAAMARVLARTKKP